MRTHREWYEIKTMCSENRTATTFAVSVDDTGAAVSTLALSRTSFHTAGLEI